MVAEGFAQHIVAQGVLADFLVAVGPAADHHLGAAELVSVGVVDDVDPFVYAVLQVRAQFEEPCGAYRQNAVNGDSDAGFEVGVVAVVADHIQRNGAVCEEEVAAGNAGQVDLEAGFTVFGADYCHGEHGGDVALAGCNYTFRVEHGEGKAAGIVDGGEEVEAAERQAVQPVLGYYLL